MYRFLSLSLASLALAGCASMPDVTATYNFPRAETALVITQTLGCNANNSALFTATTVTPTTAYVSDPTATEHGQVAYDKFGGLLKDGDVAINYTADGRLSGINSTNTGEAGSVIKNVVTLAVAAAAAAPLLAVEDHIKLPGVQAPPAPTLAQRINNTCLAIASLSGAGAAPGGGGKGGGGKGGGGAADQAAPKTPGVLTLTYTLNILFDPKDGSRIKVNSDSQPDFMDGRYPADFQSNINFIVDRDSEAQYKAIFGDPTEVNPSPFTAVISNKNVYNASRIKWNAGKIWSDNVDPPSHYTKIELNDVTIVRLTIKGPNVNFEQQLPMSNIDISVPLQAYYPLLVPTGAPFGKEQASLMLGDDGSVTKMEYSTNTGAADAFDAAGAVAKGLPTRTQQASNYQSQSDLIYQQQRLIACKADPKTCPGK